MNPFKKPNPFKEHTIKAKREKEEEDFLDELSLAAQWDPDNNYGLWPENPRRNK